MMATSTGKNFPKKKKSDPTCDVVFANSDRKNIDEAYWRWNKEGLTVFIKNLKSAEEEEKLK
ncbi:hypothetical protein TIFTF001_004258 [Ficus carica]|uniref:Uncharacterized protein n=1 Tax=Ficus carica TaxID=3494 RepID=A0AA87ZIM7_FICCA|nr:hypothetical protein TIFTF001_004258 [Ficus carica]